MQPVLGVPSGWVIGFRAYFPGSRDVPQTHYSIVNGSIQIISDVSGVCDARLKKNCPEALCTLFSDIGIGGGLDDQQGTREVFVTFVLPCID